MLVPTVLDFPLEFAANLLTGLDSTPTSKNKAAAGQYTDPDAALNLEAVINPHGKSDETK